jgi:hypothetical protein
VIRKKKEQMLFSQFFLLFFSSTLVHIVSQIKEDEFVHIYNNLLPVHIYIYIYIYIFLYVGIKEN